MANFCSNCGHTIDQKTGACPNCKQTDNTKNQKSDKNKNLIIAILCCICILTVIKSGAFTSSDSNSTITTVATTSTKEFTSTQPTYNTYTTEPYTSNLPSYTTEKYTSTQQSYGNYTTENYTFTVPTTAAPTLKDILIDGYWESKVQAHIVYKFNPDGTGVEYSCTGMAITDENLNDSSKCFPENFTYTLIGDRLTIYWQRGYTSTVEYVSKSDNYQWDMGIFDILTANEKFFYETSFVNTGEPSSNAFYISRCHDYVG